MQTYYKDALFNCYDALATLTYNSERNEKKEALREIKRIINGLNVPNEAIQVIQEINQTIRGFFKGMLSPDKAYKNIMLCLLEVSELLGVG